MAGQFRECVSERCASCEGIRDLGLTDGTRQIFEDLLREGERLADDPKLTVGAENASC